MARKKKHPEHANNERWLVSYADFITLLFAFFTSLYAISTVDAQKAGKMIFSTRSAFNLDFFPTEKPVLGSPSQDKPPALPPEKALIEHSIRPVPMPIQANTRQPYTPNEVRGLAKDLQEWIRREKLEQKLSVRLSERKLVVSLAAAAFFDAGDADVRIDSLPIFDSVVRVLLQTGHQIGVEGHTDDQPVHSWRYKNNWDLSTARAVHVVSYLIEEFGYPPQLLAAAGYAAYRPVADNGTAAGRAANRRVDLVLEYVPADGRVAAAGTAAGPSKRTR